MIRRGFSDSDVIKVIGGNIIRVLRTAQSVALQQRGRPWGVQVLNNLPNDTCRTAYFVQGGERTLIE